MENLNTMIHNFYTQNILSYIQLYRQYPIKIVTLIIDITLVVLLGYYLLKIVRGSRAWQLAKGIIVLIIVNALSALFKLNILHYILSAVLNWGVVLLIVLFQPELRKALEQLGTNKVTKYFGIDKDIITKTKEDIYKIVIAATEIAKANEGALIVIQRDIELDDIIRTGIAIEGEVSPQLLANIFVPNTPLHDGAVIIRNNKIAAAACMLPLAQDNDIAKEFGTRHRAALGIAKETDCVVVVVSEETGKISVAKDGNLIVDVKEEALKKMLISSIVTKRLVTPEEQKAKIRNVRNKFTSKIGKKKHPSDTKNKENTDEKH